MNNVDFERAETKYNRDYDPYADQRCPICGADALEEVENIYDIEYECTCCGFQGS